MSYAGASVSATNARYLYSDARGSVVLSTNEAHTLPTVNTYDPYGVPGSSNTGRFQYTGQVWLEEAGLYYYKARMYSPTLGRFLQTDPIGYEDNVNLYAYVGNDPVNGVDPSGTSDLNLFGSNDGLYEAGERFEPNNESARIFTIFGHATAAGVRDNRGNVRGELLDERRLVEVARENGFRSGMIMFLAACNLATGNFASNLAIAADSTVIAANGFVQIASTDNGWNPNSATPVNLRVTEGRESNSRERNFIRYDSNGRVTGSYDRARYTPASRSITFTNSEARTGTRIPDRIRVCVDDAGCD